jgi:hypothetical protein
VKENMSESFWSATRIAGLLLLSGALIPIGGTLALAVFTGYRPVIGGSLQDLGRLAGEVTAHRWALTFWVAGYLAALAGFGLLTSLMQETNTRAIASIALIGMVIVIVFVAIEATFHISVTTWVAEKTVLDSAVPSFYEPLRLWISMSVQPIYVVLGLLAIAGYGWAFLRTDLLPDLLGWASIAWCTLWLAVLVLFRITIPGTLLIMSSVIGIALLL